MEAGKYSMGIGDRFAMQAEAQLAAIQKASDNGIDIIPVWNKSNREHSTIGSHPAQTREAAEAAVKKLGWDKPWFVDADHINLDTVDNYVEHCNFFTIDVADYIGTQAISTDIERFASANTPFAGSLFIPGLVEQITVSMDMIKEIAGKFLFAIQQAGKIYRHIESKKGKGNFITEISMDEVTEAQSPLEMFFILSAIAAEGIPVQTIAPKFTGRFNKGVDYEGDVALFEREFEQDLLVIDFAIQAFGLPSDLKLSVHSGSDKFSIYPVIGKLIRKHNKGIHVKTAGTTWLEEAIGLALAGGEALQLVKDIYAESMGRFDELCGPYSTVIDIDKTRLPEPQEVMGWNGETLASSLRHIPGHPLYNPGMRQLMHVAYKLAAERKDIFTTLLAQNKELVAQQVTENIYGRHLKRLFDL